LREGCVKRVCFWPPSTPPAIRLLGCAPTLGEASYFGEMAESPLQMYGVPRGSSSIPPDLSRCRVPRARRGCWAAFVAPGDGRFRNLASLPRSKVLKRTASHLTFTSGWTILCVLVDYAQPGTLPNLDSTPLQVVGTAISLLLAFRTSQSYDRYWEGRGIWMETWSCCRSLKRAVVAGLWDAPGVSATARGTLDADASAIAVALIATFPLALIHHLRDQFGDEA